MNTDRKPNIGPQDLEAVKDLPFLLSQQEWYAIQRYVKNALRLPDNEKKMRLSLGKEKPYEGPFDEFQELLNGYQIVLPHVKKWDEKTFPDTVSLAQDISNYAVKAKVYYGALHQQIEKITDDPDDEAAKDKFTAICDKLAKEAANYEKHAGEVYEAIEEFAKTTSQDEVLLKDLARIYEGKYGKESAAMLAANEKIDEIKTKVEQLNKDYEHACVVASTTPTYAWAGIFGLIAAAIVAGIFGDKAVKLKHEIEVNQSEMSKLNDATQRGTILTSTLAMARKGLADIQEQIAAALPCIQKIRGVWNAIGSDLTEIGKIIQEGIVQEEYLKDLGVENAIAQWAECKLKADAYQAYAFIEVTEIQKAA